MIPAGRDPIDRAGIAGLHGLTQLDGRRRPWRDPTHPPPLSSVPGSRARPQLWDRAQATAYAAGQAIPALPTGEHPADLLDRREAAALAGVDPVAWKRDSYRNRVPPRDAAPHGVPHWRRHTVLAYRTQREQPRASPHPGGRPAGAREPLRRRDVAERVRELVADQPQISTAELARRLGVHYTTAHRHRHRHTTSPPSGTVSGLR